MSETIKTGGEKSAENAEATGQFEVLAEMSGQFDPDEARRLAERDKRETETRGRSSEHLVAIPEKQEEELSPQEAANEYLSLLDELSQDFSNPYYSDERKGQHHYANNITTELGLRYSDNPHYRWSGYASTEAGETDGTMLRIASADNIIANEIGWRDGGEEAGKKIEQIDKSISDLDADYSKKGRLGKFFGKRKYEKAKKELEQSKRAVEYQFGRKYNGNIAKELAISYNDRGDYDYNGGDYGQSQNEARNRQFFGLDDPERAKKVERAIELRRKYEAEWSKKK
jgi:hypothetical protein